MSTSLNFNLFGNVLHRKQKSQRRISDPRIIYDGALCDNIMSGSHFVLTKQLQLRWSMNRRAVSVFSASMTKLEAWVSTKTQRTLAFHILVSSFFSWCEEYNLLLPLLRNCCSLIDPFVFWRFYKVLFESIPLFWIRINFKGVQSQEIYHFETWNLFSHQFWFDKLRFQPPK